MEFSRAEKFSRILQVIGFSVVTLFAIGFLILSFFVLNEKVPENYVEVEALIVDIAKTENRDGYTGEISYEYQVYIDYSYGEKTYQHIEYNKYDSSMEVGKTVTIYVNPNSSEEFMSDTSDNYIFMILSGVFLVIGVVGLVINVKKLVDIKRREE